MAAPDRHNTEMASHHCERSALILLRHFALPSFYSLHFPRSLSSSFDDGARKRDRDNFSQLQFPDQLRNGEWAIRCRTHRVDQHESDRSGACSTLTTRTSGPTLARSQTGASRVTGTGPRSPATPRNVRGRDQAHVPHPATQKSFRLSWQSPSQVQGRKKVTLFALPYNGQKVVEIFVSWGICTPSPPPPLASHFRACVNCTSPAQKRSAICCRIHRHLHSRTRLGREGVTLKK